MGRGHPIEAIAPLELPQANAWDLGGSTSDAGWDLGGGYDDEYGADDAGRGTA